MSAPAGRASREGWVWLALALLVLVVHFTAYDVARTAVQTDIRYYVAYAPQVAAGAVPHRDLFDNKPELASVVGALFCRVAASLGADPLSAMRWGFLGLAGVLGLLLFAIQRRLAQGDGVAGLLAVLAYTGFTLLGTMPSIGPIPKLLMALLAAAAALAADTRRWVLAGATGALAFFDWQIGGLAFLAVLAAAALEADRPASGARHERAQGRRRVPARSQAVLRVALGGGAAALLVAGWLAWHGALHAALRQVISTTLARGGSALAARGELARLVDIWDTLRAGCPGHLWLALAGVLGLAIYPLWLRRHWARPTRGLAVALAVFHYGVVAFSLLDFQAFGDLFVLLESLAFFAGVTLIEGYARAGDGLARISRRVPLLGWLVRLWPALAVGLLALAMRPGLPRGEISFPRQITRGAASLAEQREVARALAARTAGLRLGFVGCAEQILLAGLPNHLPFAFWNRAAHWYFRASADERSSDALRRMVEAAGLDGVVCPTLRLARQLERRAGWERVELRARPGGYTVELLLRPPRSAGRDEAR